MAGANRRDIHDPNGDEGGGIDRSEPLLEKYKRLSKERLAAVLEQARRNIPTCMLCKWISMDIKKDEFPEPARQAHLMLCPLRDLERRDDGGR